MEHLLHRLYGVDAPGDRPRNGNIDTNRRNRLSAISPNNNILYCNRKQTDTIDTYNIKQKIQLLQAGPWHNDT